MLLLSLNMGMAQVIMPRDSITLSIDSTHFKAKITAGGDTLFEFVPTLNQLLPARDTKKVGTAQLLRNSTSENPDLRAAYSSNIPITVTLDKSMDVGEIPIESNTTNGAVTYNIPIEVYPSPKGFQPTVSLSYNSMGDNGVAGYGWNIGGMSMISVAHSNYYYDGLAAQAAKVDKSSAYLLDGKRLIKISETSSQITYQTVQGYIKVINNAPSGKYYFDVYYPDGRKAVYGYKTTTTAKPSYPLTRLEDNFGNYIEYAYTESSNLVYPTEIKYGKGTTFLGSVKFTYQDRTDTKTMYLAGLALKQDKLLTKIETYYLTTLLRTYSLTYETNLYNFLTKVNCIADSKQFNPLVFYYGEDQTTGYFQGGTAVLDSYFANNKAPDLVLTKGKFNSLAVSDGLVAYPNFSRFGVTAYNSKGASYGSLYSDTQNLLIYKSLEDYYCVPTKIQTGTGFQSLNTADIDGDGNDELVKVNYWYQNSKANLYITTYDKSLTAKGASFLLEGAFSSGGLHSAMPRTFLTGDFNGDGKIELLAISGYKTPTKEERTSRITLINLEKETILYDENFADYDYFEDILLALDYDGDGKTDICLIDKDGTHIYTYANNTFTQIATTSELKNLFFGETTKRQLLVGDLNGDGMPDLIVSPIKSYPVWKKKHLGECQGACSASSPIGSSADGSILVYKDGSKYCEVYKDEFIKEYPSNAFVWNFLYSTGNGFVSETKNFTGAANEDMNKFIVQDINGDKLPDFIIKSDTQITAYLNKNGVISTTAESARFTVEKDAFFISAAVDNGSDYRTSQLLSIKDAIVTPITFTRNDARQRMLTAVINSSGIVNRHNYENLTAGSVYYTTSSQMSYPYTKLYTDLNVVSRSDVYSGSTMVISTSFNYQDAVIHRLGLGFCGFQKVTTTDNIRNTVLNQTFDPATFGALKSVDSPTASITYNYNLSIAANKIASLTILNKTEKDKLKDVTVTSTYTYDVYGNPLTEINDFESGLKTTVNRKYNNLTGPIYKIGELYDETTINERGGLNWSSRKYISDIDETSRLPKVVLIYANDNQTSETIYTYSSDNITEESVKNYVATTTLVNKYAYDTYGRVSRKTDPLGLYVDYAYNAKGLLSSAKNQKSLETKYEYDSWGRNIKTTFADGTTEIMTSSWVNDNSTSGGSGSGSPGSKEAIVLSSKVSQGTAVIACKTITLQPGFSFAAASGNSMSFALNPDLCIPLPQGGVGGNVSYMITKAVTGQPDTQTYFDALGREIRTGEKRFDGRFLYTDNVYDDKGRLEKTSLPFKDSPAFWNTYVYDTYDRITSQAYASGKKDIYSYDKNKVTATIDSIAKTTSYDATGQVINVVDPAGTITYNYRPDGQPSSIVAPGNVTTSFEYDGFGRQTKLIDPSAGTKIFAYDAAGNINKETDARGKITNMIYDSYNRIEKKEIVGEQIIGYKYNADNGKISSVSSTNGTGTTYIYDNLLRLSDEKETIVDGKWFQKIFSYANGNVSSIAYKAQSGDIVTENYTYTNGHHTETKLNNTTSIWKLTAENSIGMPTASSTGILSRTYGYDNYGLPTSRVIKNGTTVIQNFGYNFNAQTGNLNWRKDNTRNIQENFGFDGLNRLTAINNISSIVYDIKGNTTSKVSLGTFEYNDVKKPYAVTDIIPGSGILQTTDSIVYNNMMRPSLIIAGSITTSFTYNGNADRVKMHVKNNGMDQLQRYYAGGQYEVDVRLTGTEERLYLGGDAYSAPAVYVRQGTGAWQVQYVGRDYLGSITHLIDATGVVKQELSYDPWGRLRNPVNQVLYASGSEVVPILGSRGYTGHEHLINFGLINMNARLYDPVVGRFLSPDPYIQAPDFSQSFNRYSYCWNNPLRYNDLNGEWLGIDDLVAGIIGGVVNLGVNIWQGNIHGTPWQMVGQGAAAFGAGAGAGVLALYGPAGWAAGGALVGSTNAWLGGATGADILTGGLVGSVSGLAGGFAGQFAANTLGAVIVNGFKITSPIVKGAVGGFLGGAGGGYGGGFAAGFIMTGDIGQANQMGLSGMKSGAAIGMFTGAISGYRQNQKTQAANRTAQSTGKYSVYEGVDPVTGEVKYVGMTGRDPEVRFNEHLNSGTSKAGLDYRVVKSGIGARTDARIYEQTLINKHGMGNLFNKINSISPKYWGKYGID